MTQKELYDSRDETKEIIRRLTTQARRETVQRGRPTWRTRNKIVNEITRARQLEKDLREQLVSQEIIGFELY